MTLVKSEEVVFDNIEQNNPALEVNVTSDSLFGLSSSAVFEGSFMSSTTAGSSFTSSAGASLNSYISGYGIFKLFK